ncbi:MAG: RHS repeat-associated core domain-containing protein [Bryobacteraceae bacterium]
MSRPQIEVRVPGGVAAGVGLRFGARSHHARYNGDSTLKDKVDAKFQKVAYFYDAYKRVTEIKRYPKDPMANQPSTTEDACQNTKFYYDGNSAYGTNLVGRMAWVEYPICAPNKNGVAITRTVREMYSYTTAGSAIGRRFRLIRPFEGNLNHTPYADADFSMAYDGFGRVVQLVQPDFKTWDASNHTIYTSPGYTLDYTFDSMYRVSGLTRKQGSNPAANIVTGMTYGPAGELLAMQHWQNGSNAGQYETRQYNVMGQLTRLQATATGGTAVDLKYYYSATQNNGRITQRENVISGEMVTYTYDSLQRLTAASAAGPSPWSESYAYDGFGNLTGKAGANWNVDGLTNRINALNYDANGNQNNSTISVYDIDNRLLTWDGTEQYRYAPDNKRVFRRYTDAQNVIQEVYSVYGPNGKVSVELAAVYDPAGGSTPGMVLNPTNTYQYGGAAGGGVGRADAGPVGYEACGWGAAVWESTSHFAGHDKDASGLHYADQRYYSSSWGRFLTADPYKASGGPSEPGSWNRYAYVEGDPINHFDPDGRRKFLVYVWGRECWGPPDDRSCENWDTSFSYSEPDDSFGYQGGGDSGGGGGGERSQRYRPDGFLIAFLALSNHNCAEAVGAPAGEAPAAAQTRLNDVEFSQASYLGVVRAEPTPSGYNIYYPAFAATGLGSTSMAINAGIWSTPRSAQSVIIDSAGVVQQPVAPGPTVDLVAATEAQLAPYVRVRGQNGTLSMAGGVQFTSVGQWQAFVLLHELRHSYGYGDSRADDGRILSECFSTAVVK